MPQNRFHKKLHLIAATVVLALTHTCGFAQYNGYSAIADEAAFKVRFAAEASKISSISSDFTQEKELMALTEKITSTGKFWYRKSDKIRMEYLKPFSYLIIINGDKLTIRDHDKENRVNVKSSKLFQQVNRILIDCVQGSILNSREFSSRVFESQRSWLIELTPTSKTFHELFKTIVLVVDRSSYAVDSVTMNEVAGDVTKIVFDHKKLNEPIPETVFTR